jgi:AraC-like DNA-binding protein
MPINTKRGFVRCESDARKDTEALRLRSDGLTYEEIARRMGCHKATALRRCERALGDIPREVADDYRKLEDLRLDELSVVLWPLVQEGNLQAIDRLLAISKRRAKLWGLDAPPQPRSPVSRQPTERDVDRRVDELMAIFDEAPD